MWSVFRLLGRVVWEIPTNIFSGLVYLMLSSTSESEEEIWQRSRYIGGAFIVPLVLWGVPTGIVLSSTVTLTGLAMMALKLVLSLAFVAIGFVLVRNTSAPRPTDPTSETMARLMTAIQIRHEEMIEEAMGERICCPECGEEFTVKSGFSEADDMAQVKCPECGDCLLSAHH